MASTNEITARVAQAFQRLSDRERRLVALTVVVGFTLFVGGGAWAAGSALDRREKRVAARKEQIDQLVSLREKYEDAAKNEQKNAQRIKGNSTSLFSLLQKSAGELGLQLNDLNERKLPVKDTDLNEVTVEVTLKEISIDKLDQFLEKVEGKRKDGVVKVQKLKVKTRFDNPEMLEVTMTVATWKPATAGGAAPAGGTP